MLKEAFVFSYIKPSFKMYGKKLAYISHLDIIYEDCSIEARSHMKIS